MSRIRFGSKWLSICEYITSRPISRFGTGFHTVRAPTDHTSKFGLHPASTGFGRVFVSPGAFPAPRFCARVGLLMERIGEFGLLQRMNFAVLSNDTTVMSP